MMIQYRRKLLEWFPATFFKYFIICGIIFSVGLYGGSYLRITETRTLRADYDKNYELINSVSVTDYFYNNILIYHMILIGFLTFGIGSMIIILYNGAVLGYFMQNAFLINNDLLKTVFLVLPHSAEYIGYLVAGSLSLIFLKKFLKRRLIETINFKIIICYSIGILLILFGAFSESLITVRFL